MAISNNSTGLRPGVCTSSTRPTAPYEGQHIYETDTDIEYVWNGSAWVVNYVSAASPAFTGTPTAPTATAGTNTTQLATTAFANTAGGLVLVASGTATSGGNLWITGCFTSAYDSYRVVISDYRSSVTQGLEVRLSSGGSVNSAGYYWMNINGGYATTSTYSQTGAANSATWLPLAVADGGSGGGSSFDLHNPLISTTTHIVGTRTDPRPAGVVGPFIGYLNNYSSYDGIYFSTNTGTFTNIKVRIYGYKQ